MGQKRKAKVKVKKVRAAKKKASVVKRLKIKARAAKVLKKQLRAKAPATEELPYDERTPLRGDYP